MRQEVVLDSGVVVLIDDFAHHPTAVRKTLEGIREALPGRRLLAVFEPRSNTTRRAVFQKEYAGSFAPADKVLFSKVDRPEKAPEGDRLDLERLRADIGAEKARVFSGPGEIASVLKAEAREGDAVVVMSNGGFGGLVQLLKSSLSAEDS